MQVIKLFQKNNYTEDELRMAYDYLLSIDNDAIFSYIDNINNIEIYLLALRMLITIYEDKEEYEKCYLIKNRLDKSIKIITKKN